MKKTIIIIACALLSCAAVNAQEAATTSRKVNYQSKATLRPTHNEFNLSYGISTFTKIGAKSRVPVEVGSQFGSAKSTGAIALEYQHYSNNGRFAFGGLLAYEHLDCKINDLVTSASGTKKIDYICVMPSIKSIWVNQAHMSFYSHVAAGVLIDASKSGSGGFAFQVDPFGMDFGGDKFRGFVQLGFGNLGIVQAGIKTCF